MVRQRTNIYKKKIIRKPQEKDKLNLIYIYIFIIIGGYKNYFNRLVMKMELKLLKEPRMPKSLVHVELSLLLSLLLLKVLYYVSPHYSQFKIQLNFRNQASLWLLCLFVPQIQNWLSSFWLF